MKIIKVAQNIEKQVSPYFDDETLENGKPRMSWRQEELNRLLDYAKQLKKAKSEIDELKAYLQLPKFHNDTTVQVQDVLDRLPNIYLN